MLARKTQWQECGQDFFCGLGQRVLATDAGEASLMDVREIVFDANAAAET
ncbi:MAG: type VI secretion system accessory protein TagJ [Burkholderiales bacterium]